MRHFGSRSIAWAAAILLIPVANSHAQVEPYFHHSVATGRAAGGSPAPGYRPSQPSYGPIPGSYDNGRYPLAFQPSTPQVAMNRMATTPTPSPARPSPAAWTATPTGGDGNYYASLFPQSGHFESAAGRAHEPAHPAAHYGYQHGHQGGPPYVHQPQVPVPAASGCGAASRCGSMTAPYTAYPAPSPACGVPTYDLASPRRGFWFGGTRGLYMTRDRSDNVWLSLDSDSLPAHLLDSHHAAMDWDYGVEMYFGRAFDCGRSALEARYWNINSEDYEASALRTAAVGDFNTPVDYTPLVFDNGGGGGPEPVANYLLNAEIHRVRRSYDFQNIEFNFLRLIGCGSTCQMDYCGPTCATNACGGCAGCGGYGSGGCGVAATSPWQMRWVLGMRYFRFEENFHFSTDRGNLIWGDDPLSEVFYEIDVANHLLGGQLGCRVDYATCGRVAFHGDTKLGIYSNYIRHRQFFGCDTPATIDDPGGPFHGSAYDITSTKQDLSMVAELDFGVDIAVNSCWSAGFGYRVVGATGVALTTAQIPHYFQDLGEARRIDSSGSLLLHGAYLQAEYVR